LKDWILIRRRQSL